MTNADITLDLIKEKFTDREWRLNHLYYIKDERGNKVLFKLNKVQKILLKNLWFFNIVPKARQLGITTFFAILYFDQVLFSKNKTAGIIAHRQEDMKKIFRNKIRFAWDNLHPWLKAKIGEPNTDSAYELVFPNGSTIFVSMTTRSGTVQFLHISEFGYICQRFPEKAEEIVTGAINSVHAGQMVSIESTAAGREGYFYEFCQNAKKAEEEERELTELDFKIFFFPWWVDDRYVLEGNFPITQEFLDYFKMLEAKYQINLSPAQKRWYVKKRQLNRDKMFAEYPSTLEEAFSVSVEGSYYAKEMSRVYLNRRIATLPIDPMIPIDTWWDLGMNDSNVIIFTQTIGPIIRVVDLYFNHGEGLPHYVKALEEKKYKYGRHIFPHDINVKELGTGVTRKQVLFDLGLTNIIVAPKIGLLDGIEKVRAIFPRLYFDEVKTEPLYDALGNYRREWDAKLGVFKDTPRHDKNSHYADALRTGAVVWREELPVGEEGESSESVQAFFG